MYNNSSNLHITTNFNDIKYTRDYQLWYYQKYLSQFM